MAFGRVIALAMAVVAAPAVTHAQVPDTVFVNGKIITVDDRFSIAQALAIRGGRIAKVGTSAEIDALKAPATRVIDLNGRIVIPGLIDNHAHWVRAAEHDELRFDGVTSRQRALEMLAQRVGATPAGEWIVVLEGWSEEQFTDEPKGFPLEELDRIAPNNPVVLQAVYNHSYLNSVALVAAKIDAGTPDPQGGKIEKDAAASRPAWCEGPAASPSSRPGCRCKRRTPGSPTPARSWPISIRSESRHGSTPADGEWAPSTTSPTDISPIAASWTSACSGLRSDSRQRRRKSMP
jgi:hypothetical protein